ncbi:MAG: DUF4402 domain-containing protein [Sphingomonas sp.]|nr:DUF4402 domain-containing protein [Sphingomonas sp.]
MLGRAWRTAAFASFVLVASPALAVSPTAQATGTARIYKPLTITKIQDLDFGTVILGAGAFTGETVTVSTAGAVTCGSGTGKITCSGSPKSAKFRLVGTANANVTLTSPGFNLTGPSTLAVTPSSTSQTVTLTAGPLDVSLGASVSVASTTPDGIYTGTWTVTADYQ